MVALPLLWEAALEARDHSGERDAEICWGVKKPLRVWHKLIYKYTSRFECVTDVARCRILFDGAPALCQTATWLLSDQREWMYS